MGLVVATIGLSEGILTPATYAMLVIIAVVTSLIAGPLLQVCVRRGGLEVEPTERSSEPGDGPPARPQRGTDATPTP